MTDFEPIDEVRAAMRGDRAALATLWGEHRRWTAAVLLTHSPAGADIDDLLQDVALKLCRSIGTLDDPTRFLPWLRSIARNTARSAGRRRAVPARRTRSLDDDGAEPEDRDAAARHDAREEGERVLAVLGRLDADYREPLLMKSVQGLSQRRIAAILGLPETTVETRLVRARRLLRDELARERSGDERTPEQTTLQPEVHR